MLLTRLPLPLRGVRLACVRPAASVRSEPGSNSQVESFDSGWLGGYSKESLRNGHLHTRRMQPESPRIVYALVMAETQRSPESVRSARRFHASWIRQDSAACVSLSSIHLSKSARGEAATTPGSACAAPFIVEARPFTRLTQESLAFNPEIACPLPRPSTWRAKALK